MTAPTTLLPVVPSDAPTPEEEARLAAGRRAEQLHLLIDADPDSTYPTFPYLTKARQAVAR